MSDLEKRITAKYILDSNGFNAGLQGINSGLKQNKAELKLASEGLKTYGNNTNNLKSVQEALGKQFELQSKKVEVYKEALEKTSVKLQDNVKERDKLKAALESNNTELKRLIDTGSKELQLYAKNSVELAKMNKQYEESKKKYGENSSEAAKLKEQITKLQGEQNKLIVINEKECKAYDKTKSEVEKLNKEYIAKEKTVEANAKAINNYNTNITKAKTEVVKTQGELNKLNKGLAESNSKWIAASKGMSKFGEGLKNASSKLNDTGDKILRLTAPLVAGGIASLKFSSDFENGLAKVSTISDETQVPIKQLGNEMIKLSNDTGIAAGSITDASYEAISAGQSTGDAVNFVSNSTKLAKAGFAETADTIDILTTVLNAYELGSKEVTDVSDTLIQVQNKGKTTVRELSADMGKVIPTAVATNTSLKQLGTGYAIMTSKGIKTAETTTYLNSMLNELSKTGTDADKALRKVSGKSFGDLMKEGKSLGDVLKMLEDYANKNKLSLKDMFGSAEAGKASLVLATNGGKDFNNMLKEMNNSAGMTDQAFNKVTNTGSERMAKSFNKLKNNTIRLGETLAPVMEKASEVIGKVADKLGGMSDEQLKSLTNTALLAVGIGGLLKVVGGTVIGVGNLVGAVGTLSKVIGGATVATEGIAGAGALAGGAGGLGALAGGLGAAAVAAAPFVLAAGAIGIAAYGIYKELNTELIPTVDLFADKVEYSSSVVSASARGMGETVVVTTTKITESTKKAVQGYLDLDKEANETLLSLSTNGPKLTEDMKKGMLVQYTDLTNKSSSLTDEMKKKSITDFKFMLEGMNELTESNKTSIEGKFRGMTFNVASLVGNQRDVVVQTITDQLNKATLLTSEQSATITKQYADMGNMIKSELEADKNKELEVLKKSLADNTALTELEKQTILKNTTEHYVQKQGLVTTYQAQIDTILKNAVEGHRQLSEQEKIQIGDIKKRMKDEAVKALSDTEEEANIILSRMKATDERLTAEQASEHIKKINKQVEEVTKKANAQADEIIRAANRQLKAGEITQDQADKIISEAERQRKDTIEAAEKQKKGVINAIEETNEELKGKIDTTTGEIKRVKDTWDGWSPGVKKFAINFSQGWLGQALGGIFDSNWTGDRNYQGGLTTMHERGYEVYSLPKQSRIYNHEASEELVMQTAESVATKVANSVLNRSNSGSGYNVTQHIYSPTPSPSELARQTKNSLRELALNF